MFKKHLIEKCKLSVVAGAGSGGNTSRAMKDLTESGASESTGSIGSIDVDMKAETARKPGPGKRKKQDSFSLSGL